MACFPMRRRRKQSEVEDCDKVEEVSSSLSLQDIQTFIGPLYPELLCFGCTKFYINPYLLPCEDTICETCLQNMKSGMRQDKRGDIVVQCPICHSEFQFDTLKDVKFPQNYLMKIIVMDWRKKIEMAKLPDSADQMLQEIRIFCQLCDTKCKRSTMKKCITCNLIFCESCLYNIHGNKAFLSHTLEDASIQVDNAIKCFAHKGNEIVRYCNTDHALLCEECHRTTHEGHTTYSVHDAFKQETKDLSAMVSNFRKAMDSYERNITKLKGLKVELDETESDIDRSIFKEFLSLHQEIQLQKAQINEHVKHEKVKKQADIDHFLNTASKSIHQMEGLVYFITEALHQLNPAVLLQMSKPIKNRIRKAMCEIIEPSSSLTANPFKEIELDFSHLRAQIANLHLKVRQPKSTWVQTDDTKTMWDKAVETHPMTEDIFCLIPPSPKYFTALNITSQAVRTHPMTEDIFYLIPPSPKHVTPLNITESNSDISFWNPIISPEEEHPEPNSTTTIPDISEAHNEDVPFHHMKSSLADHSSSCKKEDKNICFNVYENQDPELYHSRCLSPGHVSDSQTVPEKSVACSSPITIDHPPHPLNQHQTRGVRHQDVSTCPKISRTQSTNGRATRTKVRKRTKSSPPVFNLQTKNPESSDREGYHSDSSIDSSIGSSISSPFITKHSLDVPGQPIIFEHTVDGNSVKISWVLLTRDHVVKYYEVQLHEILSTNKQRSPFREQAGTYSGIKQEYFQATDLNPNSEYLFKVRAVNKAGPGEWSEPYNVVSESIC
ncbi:uncharacterized protein LOC142485087 [Ascaphus truei]|uniref:uncharacterized protein LOC142485087 n=1 Tax=Ascaphus truei TaxID=8439 RepID=UPI003F5954AF